jgi:purine-binding chemotaxis protein CheW
MEAGKKGANAELKIVVFKLAGVSYAVSISSVREVIKLVNFVILPNAPEYIAGVINLRGHIICTLDLRKKFHLPSEDTEKTRIMITKLRGAPVGVIVDEVEEVLTITRSDIDITPPIINQHLPNTCIVGIAKYQEKLIILVNINNILSPDELKSLNILTK